MSTTVILIGLFIISLVLSAFFSGSETGFVSCNRLRVRQLAEKGDDINAKRLLLYLNRPDNMLAVVLLGNNLVLMLGMIAITQLVGGIWATIIAMPTILLFGEIIPKSVFRTHPTRLSLFILPAIRFFESLFIPMVLPLNWFSRHFLTAASNEDKDSIRNLMRSTDDMRTLVDESADRGTIEPEEQEMIHSVMDLQTKQANEVMVPRIDINALPDFATRAELIRMFKESGHTRIPIYHETIDEITGVINAFDVLRDENPAEPDIRRFVREILHVPDTMKLDDVLQAFRNSRQSMAVVTDEYGGTDGLIAIEDVLEQIFGDIHDEYDKDEPSIRKVGPNDYVIKTRVSLDDASEFIGLPIEDDEVETIGGWLMRQAARIPQKGEVIVQSGFRITVLDGGPNFVSVIRLEILQGASQSDGETKKG
jgi:putative hemolysin